MDKDSKLFKDTSLADLFEHVYVSSKKKDKELRALMTTVSAMIQTTTDAVVLLPIFAEVFSTGIKNDELIVKLTAVVQRLVAAEGKGVGENTGGLAITEAEKADIMKEIAAFSGEDQSIEAQLARVRGGVKIKVDTAPIKE
jgi:hypothetical protein